MKKLIFFLFTIFCALDTNAQDNLSALLPYPNHIEQKQGVFRVLPAETVYSNSAELEFAQSELKQIIKKRFGFEPKTAKNGKIRLLLNPQIAGNEQYKLLVDAKGITVEGKTPAGVLYGVLTLDQLLLGDVTNTRQGKVRSVFINDTPAYAFRALMLDPARNFLPLDDVKFYIDQMTRYKYNVLQLHLTDDQGWRIEIKSHPKLTEIGAFRNPKAGKKAPDNGFYTQEELKELVRYAAQRNVEILPEIDVPGHTVALLSAYPELRCDFLKDSVFDMNNKTFDMMLSAANQRVYEVLDDVIRETSAIFPSKKIHLGGDESAVKKNWGKSPENLQLMKEKGYTKPEQLMNVFFGNVLASVKKYGMHPILWCELDNIYPPANGFLFDYPKDVTLLAWRGGLTQKCIELTAKSGNPIILAPGEHCYLDYPQYKNDLPEFNNWGMPITTLTKTYEFEPAYNFSPEQTTHIQGVMGTLWGEAIKDINRANYMTYPRGLALAEAGWTQKTHRDWTSFKSRLYPNLVELIKRGVSVRAPFEISDKRK